MKRLTATLLFLVVIGAFAAPAMASGGNPGLEITFTLASTPKIDAIIVLDANHPTVSPTGGQASIYLKDGAGRQASANFTVPFVLGCDPQKDTLPVQATGRFLNGALDAELGGVVPHLTLVQLFATFGVSVVNDTPFVIPFVSQIASAKCVPAPGSAFSYDVIEAVIQLAVPPKK